MSLLVFSIGMPILSITNVEFFSGQVSPFVGLPCVLYVIIISHNNVLLVVSVDPVCFCCFRAAYKLKCISS